MIKIETARRWGNSVTVPLTDFLAEGKQYIIEDALIEGKKCIVMRMYRQASDLEFVRKESDSERDNKKEIDIPLV